MRLGKKNKQTDERDTDSQLFHLRKKGTNLEKTLFQAFPKTNKKLLF